MCGLAGFSGNFLKELLPAMAETMAYRGPDSQDVYYHNNVGLAHRRLSIVDVSDAGRQPMWDATHSVCVVFNGEIYNFSAFRQELLSQGFTFNNHTDTEVILNLYLRDGIDFLQKLNGIFAFALYDARRDYLLVARDHLGVKPLYYTKTPKGVLFASELKAFLQEESVDREINPRAIQNYLRYLWSPSPDTMFRSIKKLLPGHAMLIRNGSIEKQWEYYDLPYTNLIEPFSEQEAAEMLRDKLKTAVQRQLGADVPIGTFLSGGLDSSALVAMVKQIDPDKALPCFTIRFSDSFGKSEGAAEDLPYAERVAKQFNVPLHVVEVKADIVDQLSKIIDHLEEPQADLAALNTYLIAKFARSNGIKVLLSGAGGDDLFSGYRRHFALQQERYWSWLPEILRSQLVTVSHCFSSDSSFGRRVKKALQYANMNQPERLASYFYWLSPDLQESLYSDSLKHHLPTDDRLVERLLNLPKDMPLLNKMLYLETKYFLVDHNLNYTDKMSMAAGVETRVPLLDLDVVDFATRLPINFKQHGATSKWIFKKAMESYLPKDVIYRKKTGFGAPLRHWVKGQFKPIINDLLSEEAINRRGWFGAKAVRKLIEDNESGKIDAAYPIFSLLSLEIWCQQFL